MRAGPFLVPRVTSSKRQDLHRRPGVGPGLWKSGERSAAMRRLGGSAPFLGVRQAASSQNSARRPFSRTDLKTVVGSEKSASGCSEDGGRSARCAHLAVEELELAEHRSTRVADVARQFLYGRSFGEAPEPVQANLINTEELAAVGSAGNFERDPTREQDLMTAGGLNRPSDLLGGGIHVDEGVGAE